MKCMLFLISNFILHTLHPALEDGIDRVFRNVDTQQSDTGEVPKRIHTRFETRRKFEIKKVIYSFVNSFIRIGNTARVPALTGTSKLLQSILFASFVFNVVYSTSFKLFFHTGYPSCRGPAYLPCSISICKCYIFAKLRFVCSKLVTQPC